MEQIRNIEKSNEQTLKEYLINLCEGIKTVKATEGTLNIQIDECKGYKFEITCKKLKPKCETATNSFKNRKI